MDLHISLVDRTNLGGEIYRQLREAILGGRLRPGERLPASRELARRLSVSRMTVTTAYDRLAAAGLITSRVGAGTFVREDVASASATGSGPAGVLRPRVLWEDVALPPEPATPPLYDFLSGIPDGSLFPFDTWRRLMARELRAGPEAGRYGHPAGEPVLREAIARHLGVARALTVSPDDVVITNGTQQALDLLTRVLVAPGQYVAIEDPCYPPPRRLFASLGADVVGVPVDGDGLVVDALPPAARVVYTTPSHQYPLGVTLSLPRRVALLAWAREHDAAVIEDDYDSEFRFGGRPIEPLRAMDRDGRVAYVGSFSKTLLPGLRLGFAVVPPSIREALRRAKFVSDWATERFAQRALARFMADGGFVRHVRRMNRVYRERHELIVRTLATDFAGVLEPIPSAVGLHVSAFAPGRSAAAVAAVHARAAEDGVRVQQLAAFGVSGPGPAGVLLGYGAIPTGRIADGLRRLRRAFEA